MSHSHRSLVSSRRAFLAGTGMTALTALTLAACGANSRSSAGASASAKAGGNLTVLTSSSDVGWDPAKSQSMPMTSLGLVHRRLTTWKLEPGKPVELAPDLATDTGKASDDGRTWTFTLKKGLKLSDGSAITSAHIKHGVERSFAPALSGGLGYHKSLLTGAEGYQGPYSGAHLSSIETPDESTIVFHLARAFGDWPWIVAQPAFSPVPEGDDPATYSHAPIASGPYQIDQYKQGSSITLKRNPHWSKDTDSVRLALPDTFTSTDFFKSFSTKYAKLFDGLRCDSGDPFEFTERALSYYERHRIDPKKKTVVYSDSLDLEAIARIKRHVAGRLHDVYGVGTFLTNDVGVQPLNIVIKLFEVKPKGETDFLPVVKLSDSPGKHTGDPDEIDLCKRMLKL